MPSDKPRVTTLLDPATYRAAAKLAAADGRSLSSWVARLVEAAVRKGVSRG